MPTVITYSAPGSGATINLCAKHDRDGVTRRAPNGAEFCQVQHGAHAGICDVCLDTAIPVTDPGRVRYFRLA